MRIFGAGKLLKDLHGLLAYTLRWPNTHVHGIIEVIKVLKYANKNSIISTQRKETTYVNMVVVFKTIAYKENGSKKRVIYELNKASLHVIFELYYYIISFYRHVRHFIKLFFSVSSDKSVKLLHY